MTTESLNQIKHFPPFLEPYTRLYSEGKLHLTQITNLYIETKAKSHYKESYADLKNVLSHCVQAKEEYYNSKTIFGTRTTAKIYHDFLTTIDIETSLEKAYKALAEADKPSAPKKPVEVKADGQVTPKLSNSSSDSESSSSSSSSSASSGSGSAQSAGEEEDDESKTNFEAQLMLARYYALSKKEISVFPMGGTKERPEKIMMANPNGNVYVLPLRDERGSDLNPIGRGQTRLIYTGELHRLGKQEPVEIAIATTMGLDKDSKKIVLNNQRMLQENKRLQQLKDTNDIEYNACFDTQVNGQEYAFAIMPKYLVGYFLNSHIPEEKLTTRNPVEFDIDDMDRMWSEHGGRVIFPPISESRDFGDASNDHISENKLPTRDDFDDEDVLSQDEDSIEVVGIIYTGPSHRDEE